MWIIVLLIVVLLWYCMDDSIVVEQHCIRTDKISKKVKLAVVSDFHCAHAEEVLDVLHEIDPDAVLIPGDLIDENVSLDSVRELLYGLRCWPCFYVSGNHEYKTGRKYTGYSQMISILEEYGVVHLENESQIITLNDQKLWIGGVQDHCSDKTKDPDELDQKHLKAVCKDLGNEFSVLLMHRPEQFELVEDRIDLMVSGHAHGGQWRFPGINGLYAPQQGLFPKRAGGMYPMKHGVHLVSRGLAKYWFLPRILNHREINVIVLDKKRAD